MTQVPCEYSHLDGSYVLGALSPAERLEFEQHMAGCKECARAVRELAGIPGLLARVDADVLEQSAVDEPLPDTLLPALAGEVRRANRRRGVLLSGLAAAVVTLVVGGVALTGVINRDNSTPSATPSTSQTTHATAAPTPKERPMTPIGHVPVSATAAVVPVSWGTRLDLTCTYAPDIADYNLPPSVTYALVVHTRDGKAERVGTWRAIHGRRMHFTAGTSSPARDIASVEITLAIGTPVLKLPRAA
jgi:hypothetical protein